MNARVEAYGLVTRARVDELVSEWLSCPGLFDYCQLAGDGEWYDLLESSAWFQSIGSSLTSYVLAQEIKLTAGGVS